MNNQEIVLGDIKEVIRLDEYGNWTDGQTTIINKETIHILNETIKEVSIKQIYTVCVISSLKYNEISLDRVCKLLNIPMTSATSKVPMKKNVLIREQEIANEVRKIADSISTLERKGFLQKVWKDDKERIFDNESAPNKDKRYTLTSLEEIGKALDR